MVHVEHRRNKTFIITYNKELLLELTEYIYLPIYQTYKFGTNINAVYDLLH